MYGTDLSGRRLVLASSSPRRIQMIRDSGVIPVVRRPEADETVTANLDVFTQTMYIALKKALKVERELLEEENYNGDFLLAADTVVYKDEVIGKPSDIPDALRIFRRLKNTIHQVITGVALLQIGTVRRKTFFEKTEVRFGDYTDQDILDYLETGEAWDKAGGYAIQGGWRKHILAIDGDYDNVVGLPWKRVREELFDMGFKR